MSRVTIEDCVKNIPNRFLLVQAAVRRTRQLMEGARASVPVKNRSAVVALREIAAQHVTPVLDPAAQPFSEVQAREAEEEEALLHASIEEVGIERLKPGATVSDFTELEGLPEEGFHEEVIGEEGDDGAEDLD
jgi:DNA-directed RNA polymerase subunit omega